MSVWATLVPSGITGIVGLAGIAGTAWQARRGREAASADLRASLDATAESLRISTSAEDKRAADSVKRRAYAALLASYGPVTAAATGFKFYDSDTDKLKHVQLMFAARNEMFAAAAEVSLLGSQLVHEITALYGTTLIEHAGRLTANEEDKLSDILGVIRWNLLQAMRMDLGMPPLGESPFSSEMSSADVNSPVVDRPVKGDDAE